MIEYVDLSHATELDAYVQAQTNCQFMQTSLWGRVKQDWGWHGLICRDNSNAIRGTMAILRHDLRLPGACLLYSPCGPVFSNMTAFAELVDGAKKLAAQKGAYLLRIDPRVAETDRSFAALASQMGFTCNQAEDYSLFQPRMCYRCQLPGSDPAAIEAMLHRSTRNNLHKAQRNDLHIVYGGVADLPVFYKLLQKTGEKNGFVPRPPEYFRSVLQGLAPYARLSLVQNGTQTVAAAISVLMGDTCSLMYSCSDPDSFKQFPNELLIYQLLCEAAAQGCSFFDFRGVEGRPTESNPKLGLHRYKQGYGAAFCAYIGQLDLKLRPMVARAVCCYEKLCSGKS